MATTAPASATLPAPVIINDGTQNSAEAQWAETQQIPHGSTTRAFVATFLVRHAPGRHITGARADLDFDGVDDTAAGTHVSVSAQTFGLPASLIQTSRVTVATLLPSVAGVSCPFNAVGATRWVEAPVRFRLFDSTGELSTTTLSSTVRFVADSNCVGAQDFPVVTSSSQTAVDVTPGQSNFYSFTCRDPDIDLFSSDDDCDRAQIRWRRLNDGQTGVVSEVTGLTDDTQHTISVSFPERGYYVVEALLGNENGSYPNAAAPTAGWWRLGNAVVNAGAASLAASIGFPAASASAPASVNAGTSVNAVLTASDTGGAIQIVEWDAENDGTFERREHTVPTTASGVVTHPALSSAQLSQSIDATEPGLVTVRARVTDNGALDAAEAIRRQLTVSAVLRINAIPVASEAAVSTAEDTALAITLGATDADNQPEALVYDIVAAPPASAGTLGAVSGSSVTFTPALNFSGSTSFQFRARDGGPATVAAHAASNTATVSITVLPVNDPPTVTPASIVTAANIPGSVQMTGMDPEDGASLTYSVATQPANGTASCTAAGLCTYAPALRFVGSDSFVVRGTDTGGLSATATVSVAVERCRGKPDSRPAACGRP